MTAEMRACILVVDDHADTVELIRLVLTRCGYGVLTATSADEATAMLRDGRCDLIISDIGLPGRSGLDLMREIRERYGIRGIALSGYVRLSDEEAATAAGFDRYLTKPIEFSALIDAVEELTSQAAPS